MYLDIILEIKYHVLNTYHIDIGNDACLLIRKFCYHYLSINLRNELFKFVSMKKFKISYINFLNQYMLASCHQSAYHH